MRVLTVLNWLVRGGIEVMLHRCLPYLRERDIFLDMCCLGPPAEMDDEFLAAGCRIFRIGKYVNPHRTARELASLLSKVECATVHSHFGYTSGGMALAANRARVPVVVSFHGGTATALYAWRRRPVLRSVRHFWLQWHRRLMEKHADIFIGHSEANIAAYEPAWHSRPDRYRVIANGVAFPQENMPKATARRLLGIRGDSLMLLHVGTFRREKNHQGLLQIAKGVLEKRDDSILVMLGGGWGDGYQDRVERFATELDIRERVVFAGSKTDVWPYYFAADVMVFPSEMEGFANVLTEAQGVGLPVVASDIPAHRESVAPSQHRFLFPLPEYDRAVELVLEQADHAGSGENDWVAASREHARRKCGMERMADDLAQLYADLVERRR